MYLVSIKDWLYSTEFCSVFFPPREISQVALSALAYTLENLPEYLNLSTLQISIFK